MQKTLDAQVVSFGGRESGQMGLESHAGVRSLVMVAGQPGGLSFCDKRRLGYSGMSSEVSALLSSEQSWLLCDRPLLGFAFSAPCGSEVGSIEPGRGGPTKNSGVLASLSQSARSCGYLD